MQTRHLNLSALIANCQKELSTCVSLLQETQEVAIPAFMAPKPPSIDAMEKIQNVDYVQQITGCVIGVLRQLSQELDDTKIAIDPAELCPKDVVSRLLA